MVSPSCITLSLRVWAGHCKHGALQSSDEVILQGKGSFTGSGMVCGLEQKPACGYLGYEHPKVQGWDCDIQRGKKAKCESPRDCGLCRGEVSHLPCCSGSCSPGLGRREEPLLDLTTTRVWPHPGIEPGSPALQADALTISWPSIEDMLVF